MYVRASKWPKVLYCACLVATMFPSGLSAASGWIGLAIGGGWVAAAGGSGLLIVLAVVICRVVTVVKLRPSLDAFVTARPQRVLRVIGIAGMAVGIVGELANFLAQPIALGLFGRPGDANVAYFVVGLYATLVSSVALPALLLFELSRMIGFEANLHERLKRMETKSMGTTRSRAQHAKDVT